MAYTDEYDPYYYGHSRGIHNAYVPDNTDDPVGSFRVDWELKSQNIAENYSVVSFKIYPSGLPMSELGYGGATPVTLYIDEVPIKQYLFSFSDSVEYYTHTFYHNSYGQRYFSVGLTYTSYGKDNLSGGSNGGGGLVWGLLGIPQGARIKSVPVAFNDEENPVITCYSYEANSTAIITTNTNQDNLDIIVSHPLPVSRELLTYTFELTEEERDALRLVCKNSNSKKLYFGTYCVSGGQVVYTHKETTFSVINANPIATGTVKDINPATLALTGDENTLIRFASTAAVSAQFTAIKQAVISGYWIEHNSNIFPETYHEFERVEGNIFAFHITDSRGNTNESFVQCPTIEYTKLTCNIDTTEKPDTDGVMNLKCSGNFYNDTFGYTASATMNTLQIQYRYKKQGGTYTEWADLDFTINDDNTYNAETVLSGFVYTDTYVFQCRAIDKLYDVQSVEYAAKSLPIFHWGEDDFVFEVPVTFNASTSGIEFPPQAPDYSQGGTMDGNLDITGDLRLKGDGNYGNSIFFGDRSYATIQELTDDTLTVTASTIKLNGTLKINDQPLEFGVWYPTLDNSAVVLYQTNSGWYQRVGDVVTAGFFIKAVCDSGYENTSISISGLPYAPTSTSTGGGMCSGAYVSAGFNFQCWAAGTNGEITGRVQACNNTSAANLITSASGLFYPRGSNEITLSGTISFIAQ